METIKIEIVTPNGAIFSGDIKSVTLPGSEGEFGVLPKHASLVTLLNAGVIEIVKVNDEKELVAINWGHVTVTETNITVLADGAVSLSGDSESEIATALNDAKELINSIGDSSLTTAALAKLEKL